MATRTFADLFHKPQYTTLEGFWNAVEDLPRVEKVPAEIGGQIVKDAYWLRDVGDHSTEGTYAEGVNSLVSGRYETVQHIEGLRPVFEGLQQMGLPVRGSIYRKESRHGAPAGRIQALLMFEGEGFRQRLRTGESLAIGIKVEHGNDGKTGLSIGGVGLNLVCTNGMMAEEFLGKINVKHVGNPTRMMERFNAFVDELLMEASYLPGIIDNMATVELKPREIEPLIAGIGIAPLHARRIDEKFDSYLVDVQRGDLTVKSVFDAVTYYGSHVYDRSYESASNLIESANKLVTYAAEGPHAIDNAVRKGEKKLAAIAAK